jgi:hypothetical protein
MSMNFFGLIFAFSCLSSLLYSASLFKLPDLWAGSFLVKTAANLDGFADTAKSRFSIDRSVFQNPARFLTHSAIALSQIPSGSIPHLSSNSPLQRDRHKIGFARNSALAASRFLKSEPLPNYDPTVKLISTHTDLQLAATSTDWIKQNQMPSIGQRFHNIFDSSATLLTFSPGRGFLPQKYAFRTSSAWITSVEVNRVRQGQQSNFLFQVWVNQVQVAEFPEQAQADSMAQKLQQILYGDPAVFDWNHLQPARTKGLPSGKVGNTVLFVIDRSLAESLNRSSDLIAIDWINRLRVALNIKPLSLVDAQSRMYGLTETKSKLEGTASWYGPYFHGRLTATGEIFNQDELTAAHPSLPFNTFLKVTNLTNGKSVIVRINDRGPYVGDRSLDLSREAAHYLGSEIAGVISYRAQIMTSRNSNTSNARLISTDSLKAY